MITDNILTLETRDVASIRLFGLVLSLSYSNPESITNLKFWDWNFSEKKLISVNMAKSNLLPKSNTFWNLWDIGKIFPGQMPPRTEKIKPRRMKNIPKIEDEEWKKIGSKRNSILFVAPIIRVTLPEE